MVKSPFYVLVFMNREEHKRGEQEYEFDCDTLAEADEAARDEVSEGKYAASIWRRSGDTSPSTYETVHVAAY